MGRGWGGVDRGWRAVYRRGHAPHMGARLILSTQSVITAAPPICFAVEVVFGFDSLIMLARNIVERNEVGNWGRRIVQRLVEGHAQHNFCKLLEQQQ